jgi:hypothetical protein
MLASAARFCDRRQGGKRQQQKEIISPGALPPLGDGLSNRKGILDTEHSKEKISRASGYRFHLHLCSAEPSSELRITDRKRVTYASAVVLFRPFDTFAVD